jgi:serine/threonine protein kinase/uncharacterized protein YegL
MALESIGRYQILELIGRGANSLVYRVHDPRFKRDVAVKIITVPDAARARNWQRRFERELQAAGRLSHRHIATYYDAEVEDDQPYVVMELVDDGTLADRFTEGALSWDQAVKLLLPLCQALSYAHRQGIVHRDVKPANVMFKASGTLKLVDFGLARWLEDQHITETDATKGTLAYMAPEQLRKEVDARSDIYALGLILIEAIGGHNVQIKADLGQTVEALTSDEPVDLRSLSGLAPPRLINIIQQMVAKDPDERYRNSRQTCQDLEAVLAHATAAWQTEPAEARIRLVNPHRMDLPAEAGNILSHLFPGTEYKSVEIESEFGKGFSNTRVFLVYPTRDDGSPELPAVIKMGPLPIIQEELNAYEQCIRHKLVQIARIEGEAILPLGSPWGALRYSLVGGGVTEVESLRSYCSHASTEELTVFLKQFFETMKQIWLYDRAEAGFRRQKSYDSLLPVNLLIRPMLPPAGAEIRQIQANATMGTWLQQGDYVRLEGFVEEERDEETVTLNFRGARDNRSPSFRLRLSEITDIDSYHVGPTFTGQILKTRADLLQTYVQDAGGQTFALAADALVLADGMTLPNPLTKLPELLRERQNVKIACIHGDLNMENILVDQEGQVHLIDFASARPDHVLHDFLRLESAVLISLLPDTLAAAGLSPETILEFYEQLHCATFSNGRQERGSPVDAVLDKPFQMLMAIRKMARTCFFNQSDWTEYYRGLIIYLLGTLKYQSLDSEPTAPLPKQIACIGAAALQKMLNVPPECEPRRFGRYQVLRELGRGGMGVVYQAHDPQMERTVAVKTLPRQWVSDPQLRQHLQREAKTIANLQHPAIVPVHDFGESKGQPFLVMSYMPGGSLNDRLQVQGPLPVDETLEIMNRLAPALDKAHAKGIIHRDIKPANIVFDEEGQAFLADFGIARRAGTVTGMATDFSAGTTAYTSPEQIRGHIHIDARSDIYAMGATLFMMLTGRPPYVSDTPEKLAQLHLTAPVPDVRDFRPELPRGCQSVIARAMAKEPGARFDSVSQMVRQLQTVVAKRSKPVKRAFALPWPEPERPSEASKSITDRGLIVAAWIVAAAILAGLVSLAAIYFGNGPGGKDDETPSAASGTALDSTVPATEVPIAPTQPAPDIFVDGITYLIALDTSTTMDGQKLESAAIAIADFIEALRSRDEVQVYSFNDEVRALLPLSRALSVHASLDQALRNLAAAGGSALYDAVCEVAEAAKLAQKGNVGQTRLYKVVIITDGPDSNSRKTESEMFDECVSRDEWPAGIKVFTIAYGGNADETSLRRIANRTSGRYFAADPGSIEDVLDLVSRE